ncbi:MAG: MFS transporter [Bacilli bacterium]|nr:MFS transporter [Bacilli bacterium]
MKRKNPFSTLSKIKTLDLKIILFLVSLTLITMGSTNLSKYIDVYFNDLGLSTTSLGNFVLVTGFVSVAASALIVPFVSKLKRQLLFIIITQIISALIVFYVFRANNFILSIYTVYNVYIIIKAVFLPLEQNYISRQVDRDSIGTITGIRQSFVSIGNVIGPLLGGLLYSIKPLLLFDISGTLFLMGAFLLSIVLLMEKRIKEI